MYIYIYIYIIVEKITCPHFLKTCSSRTIKHPCSRDKMQRNALIQ